jgi:hypothetical protein
MKNTITNRYIGTEAEPMNSSELEIYRSFLEKEWAKYSSSKNIKPEDRGFYLEVLPAVIPTIIDRCAKKSDFGPVQIEPCVERHVSTGYGTSFEAPEGSWSLHLPTPIGVIDQIGKMQLGYFPIFSSYYEYSETEGCIKRREDRWEMEYYLYPAIFHGCKERVMEAVRKLNPIGFKVLEDLTPEKEYLGKPFDDLKKFFKFDDGMQVRHNPRVFLRDEKTRIESFVDDTLRTEKGIAFISSNGCQRLYRDREYTLYPQVENVDISCEVQSIRKKLSTAGLPEISGLDEVVAQASDAHKFLLATASAKLKMLLSALDRKLRKQYSPLELDLEKYPFYSNGKTLF